MNLNDIPRGQLSTIILSTLLDGDKYGYEILTGIEERTSGQVVIKKPTLYSSLARMEKQDLLSSYWKDSEIGGRRHYYRLTDFGKKQVLEWQAQLVSSQNKLSQILTNQDDKVIFDNAVKTSAQMQIETKQNEKTATALSNDSNAEIALNNQTDEHKATFLQQENLFELANIKQHSPAQKAEETHKIKSEFVQYDLFSNTGFIAAPLEDAPKSIAVISDEPTIFDVNKENIKLENLNEISQKNEMPLEEQKLKKLENAESESLVKSRLFKKSIEELLKNEKGAELDQKLQMAKKSFNFEQEYNKHFKTIKSYAETLEGNEKAESPAFSFNQPKENVIYTSLVEDENEKTEFDLESMQDDRSQNKSFTESEFTAEDNVQSPSIIITSQEKSINELEAASTGLSQSEQTLEKLQMSFDDAVFITATAQQENLPKVKKIAPATFDHGIVPSPALQKAKKKEELQTRIENPKELEVKKPLGKGKGNLEINKPETEVVTMSPADEHFSRLGIKFKAYHQKLKREKIDISKAEKNDLLPINKFNMFVSLGLMILMGLQSLILALVLKFTSLLPSTAIWVYVFVNVSTLVFFIVQLVKYFKNKQKQVLKQNVQRSPLVQKIVLIAVILVFIYAIHILAGMSVFNYKYYLTTLLTPCLLAINYIIYHFVQMFYLKVKEK